MIAPHTVHEPARLQALRRSGLLDSPPERAYDEITELASIICNVPIAMISLVDAERQWFKSKVGVDATETHRDLAFCAHAIHDSGPMFVSNATLDERFRDNPLVLENPKIRFYAGYPLADPDGYNLGTLCVIDREPRELSTEQRKSLEVLAKQVVTLISLRAEITRRERVEAELKSSEQRFRAFMDHSPATAYIKDSEGHYLYVSKQVCEQFFKPESDWLGRADSEIWAPEVAEKLRAIDVAVLDSGAVKKVIETVPLASGKVAQWLSFKFPFTDSDGRRCLAGMSLDVTTERERERALRESEEKFRSVIESLAEGVYLIDNHTGKVTEANGTMTAMLGYSKEELFGFRAGDLFTGEDEDSVRRTSIDAEAGLRRDGRFDLGRRTYRCKDGTLLAVYVQLGHVSHGERGLTSVIVRDITEQRRYEDRLEEYQRELESANSALQTLATTDGLTGAKNRAAFNKRLTHEIDRTQRFGRPLSLLLLDVDHFKTFNDTFGHPAGDEVLKTVAGILERAIRETDFSARYGGEEFAVILPETNRAGAVVIAERCRNMIADLDWPKRAITVSIGTSTVSGAEAEGDVLLEEADLALYRSKKHGRNRVTQADPSPTGQTIQ